MSANEELEELKRQVAALTSQVSALNAQVGEIRRRDVSLDMASVIHAMRNLFMTNQTPRKSQGGWGKGAFGSHGHVIVLNLLSDLAAEEPGALFGRTLIEVGTTRERMLSQGSTEKLAFFTGLLGMRFVSVDMDPLNTTLAKRVIHFLNPAADAFTAKGEEFLASTDLPLEFIYLDAYDYDHGKHSEVRQSNYRRHLGESISNEACWKMHLDCAQAIDAKMGVGGLVIIDDTWTEADGTFNGKGRLAVPFLQERGFEIVHKQQMTVALKRTARTG